MQLSREARLVAGLTLLTVPTIMYGGITLLGILTKGTAGLAPGGLTLDETQWCVPRGTRSRGSMGRFVAPDPGFARCSDVTGRAQVASARISAPVAAVGIAGGFFGIAFVQAFRWLLYFGAASLAVAVVLTGIGLVRRPSGNP